MQRRTERADRPTTKVSPGWVSRRELLRRTAAVGLSVPLATALAPWRGATAQDASPAAQPPSGEPITIGAAVSTTGSNGRTGLYQQEAYLLWEEQKNAAGGLLGRPVRMIIYDDQSRSEERRVGKECRSRWSPYH